MSEGSVKDLQKLLGANGRKITTDMAKSFNECGETPLLLAIKKNNHLMVAFLVEVLDAPVNQMGRFLWNGIDYPEVPPLFAAIISQKTFDPLIVKCLIIALNTGKRLTHLIPVNALIDSILESPNSNRVQKIDILELIGAAFILAFIRDFIEVIQPDLLEFAVDCWKKAMILRQATPESEPPIPKIIPRNPFLKNGRTLFDNYSEFTALKELVQMAASVNNNWFVSQALLVTNRIVNTITPVPNLYLLWNLAYGYDGRFTTLKVLIDIHMYVLEILEARQWTDFKNEYHGYISIHISIFYLREMRNRTIGYSREEEFRLLMEALGYLSTFLASINEFRISLEHIKRLFDLVSLTIDMLPELSPHETQQFMRWLFQYFRFIDGSIRTLGLLGFACLHLNNSTEIIETFLKAGTNPNPVYEDGDTLMHKLAQQWPNNSDVVKMLLEAGSHNLDVVNPKGETALDIFQRKQLSLEGNLDPILQSLMKNVLPLQCQCALVIRRNRIPFDELQPPAILSFVKSHGTDQKC